jgi:hypothetical protein
MTKRKHAKPVAKKIKIIKISPVEGEPEKQHVELIVEAAPVPLPEHPLILPVEIVPDEFVVARDDYVPDDQALHVPEEKKGIIAWLKSWWD